MTDLDSRGLRFTDMFGQKFSRPGLASYRCWGSRSAQ